MPPILRIRLPAEASVSGSGVFFRILYHEPWSAIRVADRHGHSSSGGLLAESNRSGPVHSRPLHETIDHLFLTGLFKGDGELVAVDFHHLAVAELLVKYAVVERELRNSAGRFRDQFALDHHRPAFAAGEAVAATARSIAPRA